MKHKVFFIGGGAIATALGNVLAGNPDLEVTLLTIEKAVIKTINENHVNLKYFPGLKLNESLNASGDFARVGEEAIVFIAIPSVAAIDFIRTLQIHPRSIIINLAKGFGCNRQTINECLEQIIPNQVSSLKGPSFAREIMNNQPTAFTVGSKAKKHFVLLSSMFKQTHIFLDYSDDIRGVEFLSILKNIYAIAIGIVDAQFESPNLRFLVFTKALKEMRKLMIAFGGSKKTLFNYCGVGDYALTSLSDLSRNRTLGLLIGKGFFTEYISEKVVLEGRIAVDVFHDEILERGWSLNDYPILSELYSVFTTQYDISRFVGNVLNQNGSVRD